MVTRHDMNSSGAPVLLALRADPAPADPVEAMAARLRQLEAELGRLEADGFSLRQIVDFQEGDIARRDAIIARLNGELLRIHGTPLQNQHAQEAEMKAEISRQSAAIVDLNATIARQHGEIDRLRSANRMAANVIRSLQADLASFAPDAKMLPNDGGEAANPPIWRA